MRIRIVGAGAVDRHPPSQALMRSLASAGNQVELVARADPRPARLARFRARADLIIPATRGDLALATSWADGLGAHLSAPPSWGPRRDLDIAWAAPADVGLSSSPAGRGLPEHVDAAAQRPATPTEAHRGRAVGVVCRWTSQSPGRYLAEALEQAEVTVHRLEELDWTSMPPVDAVVIVESPLPAFETRGAAGSVPVLFWAHHGEHHTAMHLRLVARYGVDAVLLAHSWHLAHRFPVPVHRFPFSVPTRLVDPSMPWGDRFLDAAFIGAGTTGGGAYQRRGSILDAIRHAVPAARRVIEEGATPEHMASVYATARLVPNDHGTRHRPVTMRVFEAIGSGALLLTEETPGLDRLVMPADHLLHLGDDVETQVHEALRDPQSPIRARAAAAHLHAHHTVAHRVDGLMRAIDATTPGRHRPAAPGAPDHPLLAPVTEDPLLDDVILLDMDSESGEPALDDRVVWPTGRLERLRDRPLAHAVVVGERWRGDPDAVGRAARRLVVCPEGRRDIQEAVLARHEQTVERPAPPGVVAMDLGTAGYRVTEVDRG